MNVNRSSSSSSTSISDFFNKLPFGFTNEQFEEEISKCPRTLKTLKKSLYKGEEQSKKMFYLFNPVRPPTTDSLNTNHINTNMISANNTNNINSSSNINITSNINTNNFEYIDNLNVNNACSSSYLTTPLPNNPESSNNLNVNEISTPNISNFPSPPLPLSNVVNEINTNSVLIKLKPAEALIKILKCNNASSIDQVLNTDLSNKYFFIESDLKYKSIGCNWKRKSSTSIKFDVNINPETNDYKVKRYKQNKNLISVNNDCVKLKCYEYDAVCCNSYKMHVFAVDSSNYKLIHFLGIKPTSCCCRSKHEQKVIINENKNLNPRALYLKHSDMFKHPQEISSLKHKIKMDCPIESKYQKNNNLADELQAVENLKKDGFVQEVFKINCLDKNNVSRDLPAVIMYNTMTC